MIYDNLVASEIPWSMIWYLNFAEKQKKDISILNGTHINHDQIHHQIQIRNNWFGPIFFSPGDSRTKVSLVLFHPGLEGTTKVDTDPEEGLVSFRFTPLPLMTEFSVFMPIPGIEPGSSWLGDASLKDYKIIWKTIISDIKTK